MEKRNTLLLTVIAIATLLVAVVGATFAYFASAPGSVNTEKGNVGVNASVGNTEDANKRSFVAAGGSAIQLDVTAEMMQQHYQGNGTNTSSNETIEAKLIKNTNINVTFNTTETSSEEGYSCYYDLVWTWDDESEANAFEDEEWTTKVGQKKIYPSKYYARTAPDTWETGYKEFTIKVEATPTLGSTDANLNGQQDTNKQTIVEETNIDEFGAFTGTSKQNSVKIATDEFIFAKGKEITANYDVIVKFYNLNHDQSKLMNKKFVGSVSVDNVRC